MEKTKAAFKALREGCGLSQSDVACEADVSTISVKKWESPSDPRLPPDDVWRFLCAARGALYEDARELADQMAKSAMGGKEVTLYYYRTQEDLDAVQISEGVDEPFGYANARTREIARLLDAAEVPYRIEYK